MSSVVAKGKWILYLLETPTIQLTNTDNTKELRQCTMALPHEWINPLQLKLYLETEHEHYEEKFAGYRGNLDEAAIAQNRRSKVQFFVFRFIGSSFHFCAYTDFVILVRSV